jgi:hypothetical protein
MSRSGRFRARFKPSRQLLEEAAAAIVAAGALVTHLPSSSVEPRLPNAKPPGGECACREMARMVQLARPATSLVRAGRVLFLWTAA